MTVLAERTSPTGTPDNPVGRRPLDAASVLTGYLVLLTALPSDLVVHSLGAAGTPANVYAMLCFLWWLFTRMGTTMRAARGRQPVRLALALLALSIVASYFSAMTRAIPHLEISSADRSLLTLTGWAGVLLVAADGIDSRERLSQFINRMAIAAAFLAGLGIIQYLSSWNPVAYIKVPGLVANHPFGLLSERSGLRRVVGTTSHPIEFGVVLAMLLPLTLHRAFCRPDFGRLRRWLPAAMVIVALPMPVARSAVIGSAVALLMLLPAWPLRRRISVLVALPFVLLAMRSALPGLLGTLKALFAYSGTDPSVINRQADYAPAWQYIIERPLFGRGFQTFLPETYRTLDNAYLGMTIEAGFFGVGALLLIQFVGIFTARGARRRTADPTTRDLAQSLAAAAAVPVINLATFDGLGFNMCAGFLFLNIGLCGALWRLVAAPDTMTARPVAPVRSPFRRRRRLVQLLVVGFIGMLALPIAQWGHSSPGSFFGAGSLQLANPRSPVRINELTNTADVPVLVETLTARMLAPSTRDLLRQAGYTAEYRIAAGSGSLERGTDVIGEGPIINIVTKAPTPELAIATRDGVMNELRLQLRQIQDQAGVPEIVQVTSTTLSQPAGAGYEHGSPTRAVVAVAGMLLLILPFLLRIGTAVDELVFGRRSKLASAAGQTAARYG